MAAPSRPFDLDPLFRPITMLPGVGPKLAPLIEKLIGGPKVLDLIFHLPIDVIDRRHISDIKDLKKDEVATVRLHIQKHNPAPRRGTPHRIWCSDDAGSLNLVFFNNSTDWIKKQFPEGKEMYVSGRIDMYNGVPQIVHPELYGEKLEDVAVMEPVYPLTAGVTNKVLRKAMAAALQMLPDLPEWLDEALVKREDWRIWKESVRTAHYLEGDKATVTARTRLAYDELLSDQLALMLVRARQKKKAGRPWPTTHKLKDHLIRTLPFELTNAQKRALAEINEDMAAPHRMLRLLQGDVGSGKTAVAAFTMLNVVAGGAQAAFMAPTEILARQHAESLKPWFDALGVRFVVITGRDKGKGRDVLLQQIANGAAQVVMGTHALFQDAIAFDDLGVAVIDEQHKFGVEQRVRLSDKGKGVDILVMTATPIPRTLSLTAYGDMDISILDEKPPGRKPIDTLLIAQDKVENMVAGLKRQVDAGAQAYWVCPLVEESEILNVTAAEERFDTLQAVFGDKVALVHGRMKPEEKDAVMARFSSGEVSILVATTVIEVGVNVPNATIMVIEQAERFGLAQLHQLRGRVGRGAEKSYCFLIYATPLGETARARLETLRTSEDGFYIAEKDLELRGSGEVLGTRQSGLPLYKIADLERDRDLLYMARNDAKLIIDRDLELQSPRGQALRHLLYVFEEDQAVTYLRSG